MQNKTLIKVLYIVVGILVLVSIASFFSNIFLYFIIAIVFATICRPLVNRFEKTQFFKIRVPRTLAVVLVYLLLVSVFVLFGYTFAPLISRQISIISSFEYAAILEKIIVPISTAIEDFLIENNWTESSKGFVRQEIMSDIFYRIRNMDFAKVMNQLVSFTSGVVISVLAVSFITFFLLYEKKGILRNLIISAIPNAYFEVFITALYKIEKLLSNYLIGLIFQLTTIFTLMSIGLSIMGVKYSVTIALFDAIASAIPFVGPLMGVTFGVIVSITANYDSMLWSPDLIILCLKIISVGSLVHLFDNIVTQPLIFSKSVKTHPLAIFIVIFVGAMVNGVVGMILAIPTFTIIKVSFNEFYKGFKNYHIFKI